MGFICLLKALSSEKHFLVYFTANCIKVLNKDKVPLKTWAGEIGATLSLPTQFFHEHLRQKKNTDKKVYRQPPCTTNNGHTAEMFHSQDQGDRDKGKTHTHAWVTTPGHTTDHPQADYNCVGVKWMGTLQWLLPSARMRGIWWHLQRKTHSEPFDVCLWLLCWRHVGRHIIIQGHLHHVPNDEIK